MKTYKSLKELEYDLKRLNLERQIALEELKIATNDIQDSLKPARWVVSISKFLGKYGLWVLLRKIIK
jgi:hypothetical protein